MLGCAYLWHRLAGLREYQKKHLDYRALAEGLRVQFFWELAGINEDVSEHYLRKQRSELEWIRNAIHACNLPAGGSGIKQEDFRPAEQLLRELGDEALIENADWLFLHRERPMEVPLGG